MTPRDVRAAAVEFATKHGTCVCVEAGVPDHEGCGFMLAIERLIRAERAAALRAAAEQYEQVMHGDPVSIAAWLRARAEEEGA
jgi:hypothetical protein